VKLGIIGGSGLYELAALSDSDWRDYQTPWGAPSDAMLEGLIGETQVAFLPRHGRGHRLTPSEVNYRANIDALKQAGVTDVLSISACGSFREEMAPGDFVVVDQFIDRTRGRAKSFFGDGVVAHVSLADPVCAGLGDIAADALAALGVRHHRGGTYLAMEGPQFSTRAESRAYRAAGCDVIGMTNMPEAALAREAELHYQTVAMVTDWDSWREGAAVDITDILRVLAANADNARRLVVAVAERLATHVCTTGCAAALDHAVMTAPELRPAATVARLQTVAGRVL
jgi:5'-methylthioadenosine phosphorylase